MADLNTAAHTVVRDAHIAVKVGGVALGNAEPPEGVVGHAAMLSERFGGRGVRSEERGQSPTFLTFRPQVGPVDPADEEHERRPSGGRDEWRVVT